MSGAQPEGLRARKKRVAREAIAATARRLFADRGFDAVTVAEVAAAADVSEKTVFNHFPTKEDLAFAGREQGLMRLVADITERPPGASTGEDGEIKDLIKRVIAVGGDTIEAKEGEVYVNGGRIDEDYLEPGTPTDNLPLKTIPDGHVFVMGDNRTNSEDSRIFGPIDEDAVVGRAFIRVLPVTDIGWL